jgi:RNA methyltransferase, TrmH family
MGFRRCLDDQMTQFKKHITSRQNDLVRHYRAVARGEERDLLLLDGEHLVSDAVAAGVKMRHVMVVAAAAESAKVRPLLDRLERDHVEIALASPPVMAAVSPVRSASPIVAIAERPAAASRLFGRQPALVIIACDVQDPGNLGAMVRVSEAAGASGLIATGRSADPFGWKALRGSMGSALRLPIAIERHAHEAVDEARRHGCRVVATVPRGGHGLFDVNLKGADAVLIGGEGRGLSDALVNSADERVSIPMRPPVESLNAAVTAALVLYEAHRQRASS